MWKMASVACVPTPPLPPLCILTRLVNGASLLHTATVFVHSASVCVAMLLNHYEVTINDIAVNSTRVYWRSVCGHEL